jgi:hypothetical protein
VTWAGTYLALQVPERVNTRELLSPGDLRLVSATLGVMKTLLRAVITGFGFKLGADLYKFISKKIKSPLLSEDDEDAKTDEED